MMIENELNARPLEYSEVGEKFVIHPSFASLTSLNNSIAIGPRGSGKTTMLRMLTPEALFHWKPLSDEEKRIKKEISFLGIYVPMSRILQDELEKRFKNSSLNLEQKHNIVNKIYYLNILESIIDLIHFMIKQRGFDKEAIINVSQLLNERLELGIKYCYKISSVATGISELKLKTRRQLNNSKIDLEDGSHFTNQLLTNLEPVLKLVNEIFDLEPNQKYAICFDELDIYASEFSAEMIRNLRGSATNIILKLTLAPLHEVDISLFMDPPFRVHDYEKIYLWPNLESSENSRNDEEKKYIEFSEKLAIRSLKEIKKGEYNLNKLLGSFSYRNALKMMKSTESEDNIFKGLNIDKLTNQQIENYVYYKMAERDENFKQFLIDKKVSLKNLKIDRKVSSSVVRKLKEIIFNKIINTKYIDGKLQMRGQKVPVQYHGKDMILKIIDGNPRYLKKMMQYLAHDILVINGEMQEIPINKQARALMKIKDLFIQRINSIPVGDESIKLNTKNIIHDIGTYMSNDINLNDKWKSTSFKSYLYIPDKPEMEKYTPIMKKAINNGALLIIGDTDLSGLNTVRNKELRLNYLLHIEYRIPIRKYYSTSFENIISKPLNPTLFDDI